MAVMMQLGAFVFELKTAAYQRLQRTTAYRWKGVERIGSGIAQQYLGKGDDSITLNGTIYPSNGFGTVDQVEKMRAEAGKGTPLNLVAAPSERHGTIHGKWCITSIDQTDTVFMKGGTPQKIEFTLKIKAYG